MTLTNHRCHLCGSPGYGGLISIGKGKQQCKNSISCDEQAYDNRELMGEMTESLCHHGEGDKYEQAAEAEDRVRDMYFGGRVW